MKPYTLIIGILLAVLSAPHHQAQEMKNGDFSQGMEGWILSFPKDAQPKSEIVTDGFEGKPALKIEMPETDIEAWKGKLTHKVGLPAPGGYTLTFSAKCEPTEAYVEVSVWGSQADKPKLIGERKNFQVPSDWQEFSYSFTVDNADPAASVTWLNLARSGRTFMFSNIRVVRE